MEYNLKDRNELGSENSLISFTNSDMYFKTLHRSLDKGIIPEDLNVSMSKINSLIRKLNKTTYRITEKFRREENEDFLGGHLKCMRNMFLPFVIFIIAMYSIMNVDLVDGRSVSSYLEFELY